MRIRRLAIIALFLIASGAVWTRYALATPPLDISHTVVKLVGQQESALPDDAFGLRHIPDGHISFMRTNGEVRVWTAAGNCAYLLHGATIDRLVPYATTADPPPGCSSDTNAAPILAPETTGIDSSYAGFGAILPGKDANELIGIYHGEQCGPSSPFTATIGIAVSRDGGVVWQRLGAIITGRNPAPLCTRTAGAGEPCAIIVGDYIYVYYNDWATDMPDQIHLARARVASDGVPGSWEKYYNGSFGPPGIGGQSSPVIRRSQSSDYFTGTVSVTYNNSLQGYIAVFEMNGGFYYATSQDGIQWGENTLLMAFPKPNSQLTTGDTWFSYPSLLSPSEQSHLSTSGSGYLYYAMGVIGQVPHAMVRRQFDIISGPDASVTPTAGETATPTGTAASTGTATSTVPPTVPPATATNTRPSASASPSRTPTALPPTASAVPSEPTSTPVTGTPSIPLSRQPTDVSPGGPTPPAAPPHR